MLDRHLCKIVGIPDKVARAIDMIDRLDDKLELDGDKMAPAIKKIVLRAKESWNADRE